MPPAWVLEIASPSTFRVDSADKPAVYAAMGVEEYWRLDPTGGTLFDPPLWGARRVGDRWEPIDVRAERAEVRERVPIDVRSEPGQARAEASGEVRAGASGEAHAEPSGHWRGHSEVLGLDLCWRESKLGLFDPAAGEWLLDPDARRDAHLAAAARARQTPTRRRSAASASMQRSRGVLAHACSVSLRARLARHRDGGPDTTTGPPRPPLGAAAAMAQVRAHG